MPGFNVAIVGATGAVGQALTHILSLRRFPVNNLLLLASSRSAGKSYETAFGALVVETFSPDKLVGQDFVFFATSGAHSRQFAPEVAKTGAIVIDNSSAFRLAANVPLVVPEVNPEAALRHNGIIANPNCSTIQMVVALNPIHQYAKIKRIIVSTYQAVSGAGQEGISELEEQLQSVLSGREVNVVNFSKQIAMNVIPHIDVFQENGYTQEEMKMVEETRKIMHSPDIRISATCVRVPVIRAHSEAINIETEKPLTVSKATELLSRANGVQVLDNRQNAGYPTPIDVSEKMETYVGRIRKDISCENGLALWVVADQLWKGAALNAVQIAELLVDS